MTETAHVHGITMRWGAATDPGQIRTNNEDAFVARANVWAVADGMGGHNAGEVASEIAVSTLRERLGNGAASVDVAVAAVVEANASIFHGAHSNADQRGMGTTLAALVMLQPLNDPANPTTGEQPPSRLALLNVGDSRSYLWRSGVLHRASIDHSYVQELVATGHITEAEARTHPRRNIVTRALGIEPTVRVDTWTFPLVRNDRFLLCSDGLVDEVDDDDIRAIIVANTDSPQAAAEQLVAKANANGGRDNVTVVVIDVLGGPEAVPGDDSLRTSELQQVPTWGEGEPAGETLVDAERAQPNTAQLPVIDTVATTPPPPPTVVTNADTPSKRKLGLRRFLILLAVAAALTVGITVAAIQLGGDDEVPTITSTTSTTEAPATTVERSTSTTNATSTTQPATTTSGATSTSSP
jgi:serine/threonine protein phosphatase PrpC